MPTTRLAPSPTGALHLGNARTFLINWLLARKLGWNIRLRIEDLDGPRVKIGADKLLLEDLQWLGLDWDSEPIYQSARNDIYQEAVNGLLEARLAYPCICSRKEVDQASSAPHGSDGATVYPGTCRGKFASIEEARAASGRAPAIRFAAPDEMIEFTDQFQGKRSCNVLKELGDFVIAKSDGAAYQLAVVVDDLEMTVNQIIRGDDLLDSTFRQILIYRALGQAAKIPNYTHLPLVLGPDGLRLAKRHGDTRLSFYRNLGTPASEILSLLARWCGITHVTVSHPRELIDRFSLNDLPRHPIVFTQAEDALLRGAAA